MRGIPAVNETDGSARVRVRAAYQQSSVPLPHPIKELSSTDRDTAGQPSATSSALACHPSRYRATWYSAKHTAQKINCQKKQKNNSKTFCEREGS